MSDTPSNTRIDQDIETNRDTLNTDVAQWLSALVALVGLWLIASPFVLEATETAVWNNTMVGTAIFLLAGYNFYRLSKDRLASVGIASLAVLLGLWTLISPYAIEMGSDQLATSTLISGLVVAALSAYNTYANGKADAPAHSRTRA
jgi:hypothetical protein